MNFEGMFTSYCAILLYPLAQTVQPYSLRVYYLTPLTSMATETDSIQ